MDPTLIAIVADERTLWLLTSLNGVELPADDLTAVHANAVRACLRNLIRAVDPAILNSVDGDA